MKLPAQVFCADVNIRGDLNQQSLTRLLDFRLSAASWLICCGFYCKASLFPIKPLTADHRGKTFFELTVTGDRIHVAL